MAEDLTEAARRRLLLQMPAELRRRRDAGEQLWSTEALLRDFTVIGFVAPLVYVQRKADGVRGTLEFTHKPRYYFGFEEVGDGTDLGRPADPDPRPAGG